MAGIRITLTPFSPIYDKLAERFAAFLPILACSWERGFPSNFLPLTGTRFRHSKLKRLPILQKCICDVSLTGFMVNASGVLAGRFELTNVIDSWRQSGHLVLQFLVQELLPLSPPTSLPYRS
ncbi:MAG: hypothetical protein HC869_27260 [Rhodospirillales bacterium]|nr:hypothetical protein [Rhodospirillales bacterium]